MAGMARKGAGDAGWFLMPRGWMQDPVFRPAPLSEREAYAWSVEQAAYGNHDQWFNGMEVPIQRGEFVTSLPALAREFGWTIKRVRGFLVRMIKARKWAKRGAHRGAKAPTVLIICDYEERQASPLHRGKTKGTSEAPSRARQWHRKGKEQKEGGIKEDEELADPTTRLADIAERNRALNRL
jgi:hypothetical protein